MPSRASMMRRPDSSFILVVPPARFVIEAPGPICFSRVQRTLLHGAAGCMWRSRNFWWLFGSYGLLIVLALRHSRRGRRASRRALLRPRHRRRPAHQGRARPRGGHRPCPGISRTAPGAHRGAAKEIAVRITCLSSDGTVLADSERRPRSSIWKITSIGPRCVRRCRRVLASPEAGAAAPSIRR